jgi:hypothetical protein
METSPAMFVSMSGMDLPGLKKDLILMERLVMISQVVQFLFPRTVA